MANPMPTQIIKVRRIFCGIWFMICPPQNPPMAAPTKSVSPMTHEIPPLQMKTRRTSTPIMLTTVFFIHWVSMSSSYPSSAKASRNRNPTPAPKYPQ